MFTEQHMTYVFFLYGLSFFMLGFAILVYPKKHSMFTLAPNLSLIAGFGLIHGINEWLDMFLLIQSSSPTYALELIKAITLPTSFFFLLLFGVQQIDEFQKRTLWIKACPLVLLAVWLTLVVCSPDHFKTGDIAARYLLGFPGTALTSYALFRHLSTLRQTGLKLVIKHLKFMIVVFFIYGILAGVIVKPAAFFPASLLNYDWVLHTFGVPVQIFRAVCAALLAYSTLRVLSVFHWETQQQLRESESRLRTMASASPAILFKSDTQGRFIELEGQGSEGLPIPVTALIGRPISSLFADFDFNSINAQAWKPGTVYSTKVTAHDKTYDIGYCPVQDDQGTITGYVGAAMDITKRLEAESEINAYRQELSKTRRLTELGMMSKVLAEKLRKPLNMAHVLLQRLAIDLPNQGMSDTVEQSLDQVNEAFSAVRRFCDHVDLPAMPANTALNLHESLTRIIAVFADRAEHANLTFALKDCPAQICLIIAPKELQYIVSTLIDHILDRANTDARQTLTIECHREPGLLRMQFHDTCKPLSDEEVKNAFVPFALNTSHTGHHEIGLAVVQKIVQENKGSITVTSQAGQGTQFCLILPTCPKQEV